MYGGMGRRSRWRAGDGMLPFSSGRKVEACGGANSGECCRVGFTEGSPEARQKRRISGAQVVVKYY